MKAQIIKLCVIRRLIRQIGLIGFASESGKNCCERGPWVEYRFQ